VSPEDPEGSVVNPALTLEGARAHQARMRALRDEAAAVVDQALARLVTSCRVRGLKEAAFVVAAAEDARGDPVAFAIALWTWADRAEAHAARDGGRP
jgi:hypothetical protein